MATPQCKFHGDSQDGAMEFLGYSTLQARLAPLSTVTTVTRSLRQRPSVTDGYVLYGRGDRKACEEFLEYGIDGSDAGPVIIHAPEAIATWGLNAAHPTRRGVSIFRTLSSESDKYISMTLYPASHHLSTQEFFNGETAPRELQLRPHEILVVQGALGMEVSLPIGGWLVWQGHSELPWGLDPASSDAFPFMRI
ncbi:unnamed protein product [Penicillium manginii]